MSNTTGFTLVELLVVIVVLGILAGATVFSLNPGSDQRALQGFAQRMAQRIELARDRAIQNNQEWGLQVREEGYGFLAFDDTSQRWVPQGHKPFQPDEPPSPMTFNLTVENGGFEDIDTRVFANGQVDTVGVTGADKDKNLPDVVFFSSGEASQFFIDLQWLNSERGIRLSTDGFGPMRVLDANTLTGEL
jgi:general secretion pathway protein H